MLPGRRSSRRLRPATRHVRSTCWTRGLGHMVLEETVRGRSRSRLHRRPHNPARDAAFSRRSRSESRLPNPVEVNSTSQQNFKNSNSTEWYAEGFGAWIKLQPRLSRAKAIGSV